MVAASEVKFELLQQVQASVPFSFIIWQLATIPLKVSIELTQADTFKWIIFLSTVEIGEKKSVCTDLCHVGQGHVLSGAGHLDLGLAAVEELGQVGQVLCSVAGGRALAGERT